jgi:tartrate-resistant acid phosphatase type 5
MSVGKMKKDAIAMLPFSTTLVLLVLLVIPTVSELARIQHPTKADRSLSFLVVGDWGRKGNYNQSEVALQMGIVGEKLDIDFIVSTGDNFYEYGLTGVDDPAFEESFTNIYTANSLQKQWYHVLGNHDYRGNVEAQLSPVLRQIDSRWLCLRSFIVDAEIVELFFVDTTPFVDSYFTEPSGQVYDWRGVLPREKYISNLLKDVEVSLRESRAQWKIVVGHHTIMSAGVHGNTHEMVAQLLPILEANNVDLYINGHDHCLEHISTFNSPIQFLTSGGGSKAWRGGVVHWANPDELKFYHDGQGFMSVQMTETHMEIIFYNVDGMVLHKWTNTKQTLYNSIHTKNIQAMPM